MRKCVLNADTSRRLVVWLHAPVTRTGVLLGLRAVMATEDRNIYLRRKSKSNNSVAQPY